MQTYGPRGVADYAGAKTRFGRSCQAARGAMGIFGISYNKFASLREAVMRSAMIL